jgi:hypothetical protein
VPLGAAPVEVQADPALRQQPRREVPPARCLRVADCLDGEAVLGEPLRRRRVQGGELVGRAAAQLEGEEVREQLVVTKARALRIDGDDERARALELVEDPCAGGVAGEAIGQRTGDPLEDRRAQQ